MLLHTINMIHKIETLSHASNKEENLCSMASAAALTSHIICERLDLQAKLEVLIRLV